jgi:hypothetical protein
LGYIVHHFGKLNGRLEVLHLSYVRLYFLKFFSHVYFVAKLQETPPPLFPSPRWYGTAKRVRYDPEMPLTVSYGVSRKGNAIRYDWQRFRVVPCLYGRVSAAFKGELGKLRGPWGPSFLLVLINVIVVAFSSCFFSFLAHTTSFIKADFGCKASSIKANFGFCYLHHVMNDIHHLWELIWTWFSF